MKFMQIYLFAEKEHHMEDIQLDDILTNSFLEAVPGIIIDESTPLRTYDKWKLEEWCAQSFDVTRINNLISY